MRRLIFAWGGVVFSVSWPPEGKTCGPRKPPKGLYRRGAGPLADFARSMLPSDRDLFAHFYNAAATFAARDGSREKPQLSTTTHFFGFHDKSLHLTAESVGLPVELKMIAGVACVFAYSGLVESKKITKQDLGKISKACNSISWVFRIHGDQPGH